MTQTVQRFRIPGTVLLHRPFGTTSFLIDLLMPVALGLQTKLRHPR